MFVSSNTVASVTARLQRILQRRGKSLPIETVAGVLCYVAGKLVKPVNGTLDWTPRREAMALVLIVDGTYHTEGCGHWDDIPYGLPTYALLIEAEALGMTRCT